MKFLTPVARPRSSEELKNEFRGPFAIEDLPDMLVVEGGVELARNERETRVYAQRPDLLEDLVWQSVELGFGGGGPGYGLRDVNSLSTSTGMENSLVVSSLNCDGKAMSGVEIGG